jgi:hypothetical protein
VKCGGALHLEADHGLLDAERSQYWRSLRASLAGKPTTTVAHSRLGDDACFLGENDRLSRFNAWRRAICRQSEI